MAHTFDIIAPVDLAPVAEVAIGVQFEPLTGCTGGHLGWYWRECLADWPIASDAPALPPEFERFQAQGSRIATPQIILQELTSARLQVANPAGDRLVQVQRDKLFYNWRRRSAYPGFESLLGEFLDRFHAFCRFAAEVGLGTVVPNQWEVLYVDHVRKSAGWETPSDWHRFFPGLFPACPGPPTITCESASVQWKYELPPERGRLYVSAQHVLNTETAEEALQLQSLARGPIRADRLDQSLEAGLRLGHDSVSSIFRAIASETALQTWGLG